MRSSSLNRALALGAAIVLTSAGLTGTAVADPGNGKGNGNGASASAPAQPGNGNGKGGAGTAPGASGEKPGKPAKPPKQKPAKPAKPPKQKPAKPAKPAKPGKPSTPPQGGAAPGNSGGKGPKTPKPPKPTKPPKPAPGTGGGKGDPAGNNGTVKIAALGEMDGIPNNTPHPGCTFQVEWYGFDEGADVVSTVSFAMHAPTSDVGLSVAGDTTVFVGGDPASGAGTDSGLDGVETYTLTFDGEPHPKQGYHLKLTVATPRSKGNDTKTKVFWVEPCEAAPAVDEPGTEEPGTEEPGTEEPSTDEPGTDDEAAVAADDESAVLGTQASADDESGVAGTTADAGSTATGAEAGADVPSAVDAGEDGNAVVDFIRSPVPLLVIGLGALLAAAAVLARRRSRA